MIFLKEQHCLYRVFDEIIVNYAISIKFKIKTPLMQVDISISLIWPYFLSLFLDFNLEHSIRRKMLHCCNF